jgi:hypothetical protein
MGRISCHLSQGRATWIRQVIGGERTDPAIFLKAKQTGSGRGRGVIFLKMRLASKVRRRGVAILSFQVRKTGNGQ